MSIEIETAVIKGIRTVTKANVEGVVEHKTTVALEFKGLDMATLEKLGIAAPLQLPIDLAFEWPKFPGKEQT